MLQGYLGQQSCFICLNAMNDTQLGLTLDFKHKTGFVCLNVVQECR